MIILENDYFFKWLFWKMIILENDEGLKGEGRRMRLVFGT